MTLTRRSPHLWRYKEGAQQMKQPTKTVSIIVAMDRNRLIGAQNDLPWHLPADLAYFKRTTTGHPIIMGRKTYESIGRPLPKRRNIVVTRNREFVAEGCEVVHSLEEALNRCPDGECFVIGGAELFAKALPLADRLYITQIDEVFAGDVYFPAIDLSDWALVRSTAGQVDEQNRHPHRYEVYERK